MVSLLKYRRRVTDWRSQLQKNRKKTRRVIFLFFGIYIGIGLLVDLVINTSSYPVTLTELTTSLLTFQIIPTATLIMIAIALGSLFFTFSKYDRIMLMGTVSRRITPETAKDLEEKQLYHVVEEMKVAAGLRFMPQVYIIEAPYMNAFASGYSEKSAMVAITRGLISKLNRNELQAVMAHELSHIRHLDIKLTLTVAVLSNIMLMVLDLLFYGVVYGHRAKNRENHNRLAMLVILLRYLLPFVTVILMVYLSRTREYMADAGSVELMRDNEPLARALIKIHQDHQEYIFAYREAYGLTSHEQIRRAAYLYDPVKAGVEPVKDISSFFSTHPSLEERLRALGYTKEI